MTNEEWINMFINKFNENKDYKITDIRDREKLLDELRPTGEWEEPFEMNDKTYHKCNNCHVSSQLILIDKFCPNCGAKMKGGEGK